MESDEKYILSRFGNKNHFAVPEGYFEHLQDDILASVAMLEEEKTVETCPGQDGGRRCGTGDISEGDPVYAGLQTSWEIPGILIQGGRKHLQRPVEEMHKRRMV